MPTVTKPCLAFHVQQRPGQPSYGRNKYFHLDATVRVLSKEHQYDNDVWDTKRTYWHIPRLTLTMQWDDTAVTDRRPSYGYEAVYRDCYEIDHRTAVKQAYTLQRFGRLMEKSLHAVPLGTRSFPEWLARASQLFKISIWQFGSWSEPVEMNVLNGMREVQKLLDAWAEQHLTKQRNK